MLKLVTNDIWVLDQTLTMPGGVPFPARCTVVRLADGDLWVHAPLRPDPDLIDELKKLGPVAHIIAPNTFHHLFVKRFWEQFPAAKTYAPAALQRKRPDIKWTAELQEHLWSEDFQVIPILGAHKLAETAFFHRSSKTLIITDLMFHFQEIPHWKTRLMTWLFNAAPGARISRLLRFITSDKSLFVDSLRALLKLDFDRLIMAHGELIESGGKEQLAKAIEHRYG